MLYSPTKLISCDHQTDVKGRWSDFVDGGNGCLYGIPRNARQVVEFKVEDKSMKSIGPDLGNQWNKYFNGVKADNGSIYCLPTFRCNHFLKITPKRGEDTEVVALKDQQLPKGFWMRLLEAPCVHSEGPCMYSEGPCM